MIYDFLPSKITGRKKVLFNKLCQKLKNNYKKYEISNFRLRYSNFALSGEAEYGSAEEQPYEE